MSGHGVPQWVQRRTTVRRGVGFAGIVAAMVLSVGLRSATQSPARDTASALHIRAVSPAQPGGPAPSHAAPPPPKASATGKAKASAKPSAAPTRHAAAQASTQAPPATHAAPPPPAPVRRTYVGAAYDVGYGVVQVQVTMLGSRMVDVTALSLPQGGRSSDISAMAGPQLRDEALQAQSAHIDAVSGASYTSAGYVQSLQSALDKAHA